MRAVVFSSTFYVLGVLIARLMEDVCVCRRCFALDVLKIIFAQNI